MVSDDEDDDTATNTTTPSTARRMASSTTRQLVDSKMQQVLREDMLCTAKRVKFATETETLLGKSSPASQPDSTMPPWPMLLARPVGPPPSSVSLPMLREGDSTTLPRGTMIPGMSQLTNVASHDETASICDAVAASAATSTHDAVPAPAGALTRDAAEAPTSALTPRAVGALAKTLTPRSVEALAETSTTSSVNAPATTLTPDAVDAPAETLTMSAACNHALTFVPVPCDDAFHGPGGVTGHRLDSLLRSILAWEAPPTQRPLFSFRFTELAAKKNWEILRNYDLDLGQALAAQPFSTLTTGSEFRPAAVLEPLCRFHPLWHRVRSYLTKGVRYPLAPLDETERVADLLSNFERGNHKSAVKNAERLGLMLSAEVERGWQLLLPRNAVLELPGAVLAPMGLVEQDSINELGEIIQKWRLTHDQSFEVDPLARRSVNHRLRTDGLTPCRYGRALLRHIHVIVGMRQRHPTARILQTKTDLKSAYRRLHYHWATAIQAMVLFGQFALLALRMTFGGAANPSQWSDVSELATDLCNDIVRDDGWDETELVSPHQHLIGDQVNFVADDVPFTQAAELAVDIPADDAPKADCYIDDVFAAFLEKDCDRGSRIIPFVIHLLSRPLSTDESLQREDLLSLAKFLAEATPDERKTITGWLLDTRRLQVELPGHKHKAWRNTIQKMLEADKVSIKELEELIGRLNHAGFVIPMARHFIGRLRSTLYLSPRQRFAVLTSEQRNDLVLWIEFLDMALQGISMNNLVFRKPTRIGRSDASTHGIGGFSATSGVAWRWALPESYRDRASLNALEFLASYITIWMDIHHGNAPKESCFLAQADSTSAAGWLRKSNFCDDDPFHLGIARAAASLVMGHGSCLYSQWFPGAENELADSLSRDFHLLDDELLTLFCTLIPEQVPAGFRICPLPPELVSQVLTWMDSLPWKTPSPRAPHRSKIATGGTGKPSSSPSRSSPIPSSTASRARNNIASSEPSGPPSEPTPSKTTQVHNQLLHQYLQQSAPPSMLWHRPSGMSTRPVRSTTPTATSHTFYSDN